MPRLATTLVLAAVFAAAGSAAVSSAGCSGDASSPGTDADADGAADGGADSDAGTTVDVTAASDSAGADVSDTDDMPAADSVTPDDTTTSEDTAAPDSSDAAPETPDTAPETADTEPSDDVAPLDPETVPLRGACPQADRIGGFVVEVQPEQSIIDGKVGDVVNPIAVLDEVGTDGTCRLLRKEFPFCDPLCVAGTTCAKGGICVPFPQPQDIGTVVFEGLDKEVVLEPLVPGYLYFDTLLPQPVFQPGAAVRLTSTDGWAGELELFGVGSALLELLEDEWIIQEGSDLGITWTAPAAEVRSHIYVTLNIDQHGTSPVIVTCEFPDTGSATIPATLVDELLDYGVSGFPNALVTRRTADSVDIEAGCIDLILGIPVAPTVEVSGHYPCSSSSDCPGGLSCDLPTETCK